PVTLALHLTFRLRRGSAAKLTNGPEESRPGVVTSAHSTSRIERMSDDVATTECTHPVAGAGSGAGTVLGGCAGLPLWSLSDKDIDGLVPRAYGLLGRVMGSLVLPLVREADRRGLAAAFDAPNTAGWVKDLLQVTFAEARRMVQLAKAVDGDLAA